MIKNKYQLPVWRLDKIDFLSVGSRKFIFNKIAKKNKPNLKTQNIFSFTKPGPYFKPKLFGKCTII
jgi:hypothetical protein